MYLYSDPISLAYVQCPRVQVKDSTNIGNANFRPDLNPRAKCSVYSNFKVSQQNGINANCLVNKLFQNLASYIKSADSKLKNYFGFKSTICGNRIGSDIEKQLRKKIISKCSNFNPAHVVPIQQVIVPTCDLRVVQGATDLSACMINSTEQLAIDIYNYESDNLYALPNFNIRFKWIFLISISVIIVGIFVLYVNK